MTNNEIRDMMYKRGFTFNMESESYGEPKGLYFTSETMYDRRDRNKVVIPSYGCIIYPETNQFEFYTLKSSKFDIELKTPKYEDFKDKDKFNKATDQFDETIKQELEQKEELTLTAEDLNFDNFSRGFEL